MASVRREGAKLCAGGAAALHRGLSWRPLPGHWGGRLRTADFPLPYWLQQALVFSPGTLAMGVSFNQEGLDYVDKHLDIK